MNEKKLRVLHVLKSSVYSGAENVVITIIQSLSDEYDLAYTATDGPIRKVLEEKNIRCFLQKKYTRNGLKKIIKEFNPDIVHAHDFTATVLCAGIPGTFKLISHLHYDPPWTKNWNVKTLLYFFMSFRIQRILTVSEKSFDAMIFGKKLKHKCVAVGNPVDISSIEERSNQTEVEPSDLIFVGRLVEQKNPQSFIRISQILIKEGIIQKSILLGDGELRQECEQLIGDDSRIKILGFQSNPYPYIKASKLLCMTSRWEGYGLVPIEANILGIPAIVSLTSGTEEVFGENAEELCKTEEEFINKIKAVFQNKEKYEKWKKRAEIRKESLLKMPQYMNNLQKLYNTIGKTAEK